MNDKAQLAALRADHYQTEGERHQHPRFGLDSPFEVPGTTDYVCAADEAPWPCDTALVFAAVDSEPDTETLRRLIHEGRGHNSPRGGDPWPASHCGSCWDYAEQYEATRRFIATGALADIR